MRKIRMDVYEFGATCNTMDGVRVFICGVSIFQEGYTVSKIRVQLLND